MRVLLTSVHAWPQVRRGAERYVHELAAALLRRGHAVRVLSTGEPRRDAVLGVPVRRLPVRRAVPYRCPPPWEHLAVEGAFGWQALLHGALARADVWHASSTGDGAAAAVTGLARRDLRTVFTDHGFPVRASRDRRPDRLLHRTVVRHVGGYVCVSEAAGAWLRSDYGREPDVVPPGVQLDAWRPGPRARRPLLVYSGALDEPRKGLPDLLEAIALLRRDEPDLRLRLYGPGDAGPLLAAAPAAAREAVEVARLAHPGELAEAYASAWATVLPATAESFGLAVVESLASGTPAVVRQDSGGPAGTVVPGTGVAVAGDPAALARGCAEALELAGRPGTAAACRARAADFDWDSAVVPRLEEVYARA